jgi:hypothetical protein
MDRTRKERNKKERLRGGKSQVINKTSNAGRK